jgi:hypothetical protein
MDEMGTGAAGLESSQFLKMRRAAVVLRSAGADLLVVLIDTNSEVSNFFPDLSCAGASRVTETGQFGDAVIIALSVPGLGRFIPDPGLCDI